MENSPSKATTLQEIPTIRHSYFECLRKVQDKYAKDRRVAEKIQRKWFAKQNSEVNTILYQGSSEIVKQAKEKGQGVILEDLKISVNASIEKSQVSTGLTERYKD